MTPSPSRDSAIHDAAGPASRRTDLRAGRRRRRCSRAPPASIADASADRRHTSPQRSGAWSVLRRRARAGVAPRCPRRPRPRRSPRRRVVPRRPGRVHGSYRRRRRRCVASHRGPLPRRPWRRGRRPAPCRLTAPASLGGFGILPIQSTTLCVSVVSTISVAIGGIWLATGLSVPRFVMSSTRRLWVGSPGSMRGWPLHVGVVAGSPSVVVRDAKSTDERPSSSVGSSRRRMPAPYAVEFELSLWQVTPQLMWSHASGAAATPVPSSPTVRFVRAGDGRDELLRRRAPRA